MSSDIVLNTALVAKIQNFMNDSMYKETIESASSFNSHLAAERTMRLPFLDSQTGVAQNHSNLWMEPRHRLPGMREGQIYTYPSKRWRKKRRQYLNNFMQPRVPPRKETADEGEAVITTVENTAYTPTPGTSGGTVEEFKETSNKVVDEGKQDWYDDYLDIPDAGEFDEPDADSDYDYEDTYSKRKKKKAAAPKSARQSGARGKRKITYDPITDSEKPFACDICGARYKTRPGLTYHYTHSHKDKEEEEEDEAVPASPKRDDPARRRGGPASSLPPPVLHPQQQLPPTLQPQQPPMPHHMHVPSPSGPGMMPPPQHMHNLHPPPPHLIPQQNPPHLSAQQPSPHQSGSGTPPPPRSGAPLEDGNVKKEKPRVQPSTYCDFCLGDAVENKKSGSPEELVSCSDCGRSGHPTCLQFTANMIISVKKYRWQCIECKCCSICGTSDNDDQLLFCDDCDRGYHMYCLTPPLDAPPEGSWSCTLCLAEFHRN